MINVGRGEIPLNIPPCRIEILAVQREIFLLILAIKSLICFHGRQMTLRKACGTIFLYIKGLLCDAMENNNLSQNTFSISSLSLKSCRR